MSLLNRGLTFIPTPGLVSVNTILKSRETLVRNISLKSFFANSNRKVWDPKVKTFRDKSTWTPSLSLLSEEVQKTVFQIDKCTGDICRKTDKFTKGEEVFLKLADKNNISRDERDSLNRLRDNKDLVIKQADKGSAVVVMDLANYILEADRQLSDTNYYKVLDEPIFLKNKVEIKTVLTRMNKEGFIDKKQLTFLTGPDDPRPRIFYLLPKIHKPPEKWTVPSKMPEGRPIVSDINSESQRVSQFLDSTIAPLSVLHPTYLKNTYDFVNKIRDRTVPAGCLLVTGDVTALYTNMQHDRTLRCVREMFNQHPVDKRPDEYLLALLDITLKNNDFMFNNKCYLQTCGAPMGKAYSPSLANLYMLEFDRRAMNEFHIRPECFFRFLDDIFFFWVGSVAELLEYENFLNSLIPGIKVKLEYSQVSVHFLDCTIYKKIVDDCTTLKTKVFFKPTDTHQLLHMSSYHPGHMARGSLKSQLLRFKRIGSSWDDYVSTAKILFKSLKQRGYSYSLLWGTLKEVWELEERTGNHHEQGVDKDLLPMIAPFNPLGKRLLYQFRQILQDKPMFQSTRLVNAFTNHKNLHKFLIRSDLQRSEPGGTPSVQPSKTLGSFKVCDKPNCITCRQHATSSSFFSGTASGSTHPIMGELSCRTTNIVYLITCKICKIQYVGETGRCLADRMTNHRSDIKTRKNTAVALHFNSHNEGPQPNLIQAVGIEGIISNTNNGTLRKQREAFWQNTLHTKHPLGLNCLPLVARS